jgi:hypothetical protein
MNVGLVVRAEAGRVTLQVNPESAQARRELGAVAWAVLETLALDGAGDNGRWIALGNARDLGRRMGIGKDRAATALLALRRAGLVVAHTGRDARSARFAPSRYEVRLPVSFTNDTTSAADVAAVATHPSTRARRLPANDGSLSLFTNL